MKSQYLCCFCVEKREREPLTSVLDAHHELGDGLDLAVIGCVNDHDSGADGRQQAADLAEHVELFVEKVVGHDGADENAQRAQRCDQRGRNESIGCKIAHLAHSHCR